MLRTPVWLQVVLLLAISASVFWGCVRWGEHGAMQCAIQYPHEGQCGLVAMEGDAVGAFLGAGIFLVGLIVIAVLASRRR